MAGCQEENNNGCEGNDLALRVFSFQVVKYYGQEDTEAEECEEDVDAMKVKPVGHGRAIDNEGCESRLKPIG